MFDYKLIDTFGIDPWGIFSIPLTDSKPVFTSHSSFEYFYLLVIGLDSNVVHSEKNINN